MTGRLNAARGGQALFAALPFGLDAAVNVELEFLQSRMLRVALECPLHLVLRQRPLLGFQGAFDGLHVGVGLAVGFDGLQTGARPQVDVVERQRLAVGGQRGVRLAVGTQGIGFGEHRVEGRIALVEKVHAVAHVVGLHGAGAAQHLHPFGGLAIREQAHTVAVLHLGGTAAQEQERTQGHGRQTRPRALKDSSVIR